MRCLVAILFSVTIVACHKIRSDSPVSCDNSYCYCMNDGRNLGYKTPLGSNHVKNCKCAIAEDEYAQTGMEGKTFMCDEHGNYGPVSCIGSVCHCSTLDGQNIGYESPIHQLSEKNCKCAMKQHTSGNMIGNTYSCDELGNFAPVNCIGSVCHCTTSDGKNIGYETPIADAYDKNCKCALDKYAYELTGLRGKTFSCDESGNYAPVNCIGSVCHCTTPQGQNIGYETPVHLVFQKTCQCALDKHAFEQTGMVGQIYSCDEHGNYESLRCVGSSCFCVDAYGKQTSITTVPIGQQHELNC